MIKNLILIWLGAGLGGVLRYLTSVAVNKYHTSGFPFATLLVNVLGCLLAGLLIGFSYRYGMFNKDLKLLLIVGFCGGYTTFSAFSLESFAMYQANHYVELALYIIASVLSGLLAVWAGIEMSKIQL